MTDVKSAVIRVWMVMAAALGLPGLAAAQGALTNGGNHAGTISSAGEVDVWTITTTAPNERLLVDLGETGTPDPTFTPWIRLFAPNGTLLTQAWNVAAAQVEITAAAAGTYSVWVSTNDSGQNDLGSYVVTAIRIPGGGLAVSGGDEGGTLTIGGNHTGRIALGDLDPWTITTTAPNERLIFDIGELGTSPDASAYPWIRVYGPTGALLDHSWNVLASQVEVTAVSPGTYTVVVGTNDSGLDAIYDYTLTVVRIPATFTVPANDEGGTLTNGGNHTGRITIGDLDPWTITTTAPNERLIFNIGELGTSPDASAYPLDPRLWSHRRATRPFVERPCCRGRGDGGESRHLHGRRRHQRQRPRRRLRLHPHGRPDARVVHRARQRRRRHPHQRRQPHRADCPRRPRPLDHHHHRTQRAADLQHRRTRHQPRRLRLPLRSGSMVPPARYSTIRGTSLPPRSR